MRKRSLKKWCECILGRKERTIKKSSKEQVANSSDPISVRRRNCLRTMGAVVAFPAINRQSFRVFQDSTEEYSERTVRLMRESVVIDMLNQFLYRSDQRQLRRDWLAKPGAFAEADWRRFMDTGVNAISFGSGANSFEGGVRLFAMWNSFLATYPDRLLRISSINDFARAKETGRYGIMFGCQDGAHFRDTDDVNFFYSVGQRVSQLTYHDQNLLAGSAHAEHDDGITELGEKIIARMNDVGMVIDISHAGDQTIHDVLEASKRPVILSHGSCRTLNPLHFRTTSDDTIKVLAKTGGVMGILFLANMIKDIHSEKVTIDDVIDHFDHIGRLVGFEHVGIGSDAGIETHDLASLKTRQELWSRIDPLMGTIGRRYRQQGLREAVKGLEGQKKIYNLTEGFVRRGYSDEQIRMILGENWKRVLNDNWKI